MPSRVDSFSAMTAQTTNPGQSASHVQYSQCPPQKKQRMPLNETFHIASSARTKLSMEASLPNHNLRKLVGHANLIDYAMFKLSTCAHDQQDFVTDKSFHEGVSRSQKTNYLRLHDTIAEEDYDSDESDESDDDLHETDSIDSEPAVYNERNFRTGAPARTSNSSSSTASNLLTEQPDCLYSDEDEEDDDFYEDESDDDDDYYPLTHTSFHLPDLVHDDDSDDDSQLPSPPNQPSPLEACSEMKHRQAMDSSRCCSKPVPMSATQQSSFIQDGYFIPGRNSTVIAYS